LWHAFVIDVLFAAIYATTKANILFPYAWRYLALYLVVSVLVGYLMTKFFEVPILRWRDKKYQ
jgi:peptidoglycan/LPS O-acetylase OafA/YrhL